MMYTMGGGADRGCTRALKDRALPAFLVAPREMVPRRTRQTRDIECLERASSRLETGDTDEDGA